MTDREKLIELYAKVEQMRYMRMGISECVDILIANGVRLETKQATSDKTSEENKRWIPVTEQLPENSKERVLVKIKDANNIIGFPDMDTDRYTGYNWVRWGGFVTHWMHLPEPPNEVEK